ncbi:hypothetical protein [Sphingobacterium sp. UME9]|uniref:hypothetical protein n=1 Tax=Sphingobacterium sp. UME9 TaxID=1862316 RepID=UPI001602CECC|nr:hypothetical protein [Sphingobacterium sp. UME9]MBB1647681.1 hypothetical protein [Sphingobacterium sp. UME9]
MKDRDVEYLMEKYWNGETTIDEEIMIKKYFSEMEVDDNSLAGMFKYYELLGELETDITPVEEIKLFSLGTEPKVKKMINYATIAKIAAVLIIGVGLYFTANYHYSGLQEKKEQEMAKEQFENDLKELSESLAMGKKEYQESIGELRY